MESKEYEVGYGKPPKNRQFGKPDGNPRRSGMWDVSSTPRYKLEQMMKLTSDDLKAVAADESAPLFERKLAIAINKGDWKEIKEMIHEVYGMPKQTIEAEVENTVKQALVEFIDGEPNKDTDTRGV